MPGDQDSVNGGHGRIATFRLVDWMTPPLPTEPEADYLVSALTRDKLPFSSHPPSLSFQGHRRLPQSRRIWEATIRCVDTQAAGRCLQSCRILGPGLGQIKSSIDEGMPMARGIGGEDAGAATFGNKIR